MKREKRGISPLIATVILVGLTVTIGALLWIFLSKEAKLIGEKEGAKCSAQQAAEIDFTITKCVKGSNSVDLSIQNTGKVSITSFRYKVDDLPTATMSSLDLTPGDEITTGVTDVGDKITLFPIVVQDGKVITCTDKLVQASCT